MAGRQSSPATACSVFAAKTNVSPVKLAALLAASAALPHQTRRPAGIWKSLPVDSKAGS